MKRTVLWIVIVEFVLFIAIFVVYVHQDFATLVCNIHTLHHTVHMAAETNHYHKAHNMFN